MFHVNLIFLNDVYFYIVPSELKGHVCLELASDSSTLNHSATQQPLVWSNLFLESRRNDILTLYLTKDTGWANARSTVI